MDQAVAIFKSLGVDQTIVHMIVFFLVAYVVFYFVFLKHLSTVLIERAQRTDGREKEAALLHTEYQGTADEFVAVMKEARTKATERLSEMKAQATEEQRSIVNEARESSLKEITQARETVHKNLNQEIEKVGEQIPQLAEDIIAKVLGKFDGSDGSKGFRART